MQCIPSEGRKKAFERVQVCLLDLQVACCVVLRCLGITSRNKKEVAKMAGFVTECGGEAEVASAITLEIDTTVPEWSVAKCCLEYPDSFDVRRFMGM